MAIIFSALFPSPGSHRNLCKSRRDIFWMSKKRYIRQKYGGLYDCPDCDWKWTAPATQRQGFRSHGGCGAPKIFQSEVMAMSRCPFLSSRYIIILCRRASLMSSSILPGPVFTRLLCITNSLSMRGVTKSESSVLMQIANSGFSFCIV